MADPNLILSMIRNKFNDDEYSDFEIHVGDTVFKVNNFLLKLHSDVFLACLRHDSNEKKSGIIKIEGTTSSLVESMLRFMYTGTVENLDAISFQLFEIADRYNVTELMKLCANNFVKNLSTKTVVDCLKIVYHIKDEKLKKRCLNFVAKNSNCVLKSKKWTELVAEQPQISHDFCFNLAEKNKKLKKRLKTEKIRSNQLLRYKSSPSSVIGFYEFTDTDYYADPQDLQEIEEENNPMDDQVLHQEHMPALQ